MSSTMFTIIFMVIGASNQVDFQGNIILEQDPRQQDPFYRHFSARASGVPVAAVNSVVHNVKHQSSGRLQIWDDLPSHKVRPGYTTTTPPPPAPPTTPPWVRGRPRPNYGAPWHQSDPDGRDRGTDYDGIDDAPLPRPRGRRPGGARGRRPPPPEAPHRANIPKRNEETEGEDDEGLFAGDGEGTRVQNKDDSKKKDGNGTKNGKDNEGTKENNSDKKTKKKRKSMEEKEEEEEKDEEKKEEEPVGEGADDGSIDLADAAVHNIRNASKVEKKNDSKDESDEKSKSKKKKEKPKEKKKEDDSGEGTKEDSDEEKNKKGGKKKKNEKKKEKSKDDEDDEEDENGELKEVEGEIQIPKTVDGDTDDDDEDKEERKGKKKKRKGRKDEEEDDDDEKDNEDEEDDEEEDKEDDEGSDEGSEEEEEDPPEKKKKKKNKPKCQPNRNQGHKPMNMQNGQQANSQYPNQTGPFAFAPQYPAPIAPPTTTIMPPAYTDDYDEFENMKCKEMNENEKEEDEDEEEDDDEKEEKKKRKKKKNKKKKKSKKSKKGKKKSKKRKGNHGSSLGDFLTSSEKFNNRHGAQVVDELHATDDTKSLSKSSNQDSNGIDCLTVTDEFPLKCGAWQEAGFCETNQATKFLWCRKTCHCSTTTFS